MNGSYYCNCYLSVSCSHEVPVCHFIMIWCDFRRTGRAILQWDLCSKFPTVVCGTMLHNSSALWGFLRQSCWDVTRKTDWNGNGPQSPSVPGPTKYLLAGLQEQIRYHSDDVRGRGSSSRRDMRPRQPLRMVFLLKNWLHWIWNSLKKNKYETSWSHFAESFLEENYPLSNKTWPAMQHFWLRDPRVCAEAGGERRRGQVTICQKNEREVVTADSETEKEEFDERMERLCLHLIIKCMI